MIWLFVFLYILFKKNSNVFCEENYICIFLIFIVCHYGQDGWNKLQLGEPNTLP